MHVRFEPTPEPASGEVLVRVAAAGVNRPDLLQRQGLYPPPPGASPYLGLEIAGVVAACGESVVGLKPGDEVCALTDGGGYAEYCVAPAGQCFKVPAGLNLVEAASLPEAFFTVYGNVFAPSRGALTRGETLLIHGGASGIGVTAIQLAKAAGAQVLVTAGSTEKCAACIQLGADHAFNYRTQDFVACTKEATSGRGADVILDMVGGEYIRRDVSALARDGRLIFIAFQAGSKVEIDFMPVMLKRLRITGSTLRAQSVQQKASMRDEIERKLWTFVAQGSFKPVVFATFPLERADEAHRLMEANQHIGKIVLTT